MLNGTWNLDGTRAGGYFANGSKVITVVEPETVSIFFVGTYQENLQTNVTSFSSLCMNTSVEWRVL